MLIRVERADTLFTNRYEVGDLLRIPIAHAEGNYRVDDETLEQLEGDGRVVFRYVDASGAPTEAANPNGSTRNIAGILNPEGNVLGMVSSRQLLRYELERLGDELDSLEAFLSADGPGG